MNATDAPATGGKRHRPGWVWAITIFYFLSAGFTVLSYVIVMSGAVPLPEAQQRYYASLTVFDYATTIIVGLLNLTGATLLLLLRKLAYPCLLSAWILGLTLVVYQILFRGWLAAISAPGLIGVWIGWMINVSIILYARSLARSGVLA